MDSKKKQTRFKRIKWTIKILQNVNLEFQTIQLIFFLTDFVSNLKEFESTKLELISISCIYLILKLQGDLTASLSDFNEFVTKNLEIPRSSILETELLILEAMPPSFVFIHTFSDFLVSYFPELLLFTTNNFSFTRRVCEFCMGYYLFSLEKVEFENIVAAGIKEDNYSNNIGLNLTLDFLIDNCKGVCTFDLKQIVEICNCFLTDYPYVKMIFNPSGSF